LKIKNQKTHNVGPILEIETKNSAFMNIIESKTKKPDLLQDNFLATSWYARTKERQDF
jgi:hypothetical protein